MVTVWCCVLYIYSPLLYIIAHAYIILITIKYYVQVTNLYTDASDIVNEIN